jgi:hypothetical protein
VKINGFAGFLKAALGTFLATLSTGHYTAKNRPVQSPEGASLQVILTIG